MDGRPIMRLLQFVFAASLVAVCTVPLFPAMKKWAVIAPTASKLQDLSLTQLAQFCKGSQKSWPDGKTFTLVIQDPDSPEMRPATLALFGVAPEEAKAFIGKVNQSREVIKIVHSDEDLLRTVVATPGAVGLIDVYAINSSVKVLRIDGKLPFDTGYVLKSN